MDTVKFELTYSALKLFGKQLYSNAGSAISELVANGIDANASNIYISINIIDKNSSTVEIFDDGDGMSPEDIKNHYIKIGYNKRLVQPNTKNTMLGRKGIGKLAALYLSDSFVIATKKVDSAPTYWRLDVSKTEDNDQPELIPIENPLTEELACFEQWENTKKGTFILLNNVNFFRMGEKAFESLESKLSNYYLPSELSTKLWLNVFDDIGEKSKFELIEKKIAYKNMIYIYTDDVQKFNDIRESEFKYPYKNKLGQTLEHKKTIQIEPFSTLFKKNEFTGQIDGIEYNLKGWVGIHCSIDKETATANDPLYIKNQFYNPNQLRVYVKNKLGMENLLGHLGITRAFANYIEGEITFNILDHDDLDDIATAGRQDYDSQDERFVILRQLMTNVGNSLVSKRQALADEINSIKDDTDIKISSNAKKIFAKEVHEEMEHITVFDEKAKNELETIIVNKLQGDINAEAKNEFTVFISHASKDKYVSDCIYHYLVSLGFSGNLREEGCEIFYSSSGLDTSSLEPLSKVIKETIISKNNDILFLTSSNFNNSTYCLFEGGAAWATRGIGEYKILSFNYSDIPTFLTNGKSEVVLGINEKDDFILNGIKYNQLVEIINRLILHLNKNRILSGSEEAQCLELIDFPDEVQLQRMGKSEIDFMDSELVEYWDTYVVKNCESYFEDDNS